MQLTKRTKQFFGLLILTLSILAFLQQSTHAAARWIDNAQDSFTAISPTFGVQSGARPMDPRTYVANIIKVILGFLGFLAVCLILYAGFSWMTAGGNDKRITTAQDIMKASVIGLFIILAAFSITIFVTNAIIGSTGAQGNLIRQNL